MSFADPSSEPKPADAAVADGGLALRLLLVEDSEVDARLLSENLRRCSHAQRISLQHVSRLDEAVKQLVAGNHNCVLLDLGLPDRRGVDNVTIVRSAAPEVTVVVMTGLDDESIAMEALRRGAQEYAVKGTHSGDSLARLLFHAVQRGQMVRELEAQRQQEYLNATHDTLTRLPNRRLFLDRATQALALAERAGTRVAICFLDLDDFKTVNDTHGHAVGDQLLRAAAAALARTVRNGDSLCRFGGDEFAALLASGTTELEVEKIAHRMILAIGSITEVEGNKVQISTSIGVAVFPDTADNVESLLACADRAMYAAKTERRGSYRIVGGGNGRPPGATGKPA